MRSFVPAREAVSRFVGGGILLRQGRLASVAQAVEAIESRSNWQPREGRASVPTGWGDVDAMLAQSPKTGGLQRGAVHEWLGETLSLSPSPEGRGGRNWLPPLSILIHLARQAVGAARRFNHQHVFWIGRRCWPYPLALVSRSDRVLLERSIFIETHSQAEHLWAIDLVLRSPVAAAVVADGTNVKMAHARRLHLAAAAGGALCLLARPAWEQGEISAARTRWLVRSAESTDAKPRWNIELLRCRGGQPVDGGARRWTVHRDHETGAVDLVAHVADRSHQTPDQQVKRSARQTA